MATLELHPPGLARPGDGGRAEARRRRAPVLLGVALLVVSSYAVFAHGAIEAPAEPRLQVALAVLVALVTAACAWVGSLRFAVGRAGGAALTLLAAFAAWSALSVTWSAAPDLSWLEFNRQVAYALALGLAVVLGASSARAIELAAGGFLVLVAVVALYGVGQKVLPGIRIGSVIDLNRTGAVARLQEPLGYFNALALLLAMGAPVALAVTMQPGLARAGRLGALITLQLVFVAGSFTYSRGGAAALLLGLAACLVLSRAWLRGLMWAAAAALAALPAIVLGLVSHSLSAGGVALAQREHAGWRLLIVVACCSTVLALGGDRLLVLERTTELGLVARRRVVRGLQAAVLVALLVAVAALLASPRGPAGTITHAIHSFTRPQGLGVSNPDRLFSAESSNRWVWWKEALGAFTARPVGGWGAGSFPVVHLLYRHNMLTVAHVHSAPLEWLAETGVIGAAVALAAWALLLRSGWTVVRGQPAPGRRILAASLLAGGLAYSLHALYDRDWDIPGVTLPALVLLGVLAGAAARAPRPQVLHEPGPWLRLLAVAGVALAMSVAAASVVLPNLAASRASAALVAAARGTRAALERAQNDAVSATRLDPLTDAGLEASASVALQVDRPRLARQYLLEALNRMPDDTSAWLKLAYVDMELGRRTEALLAAQRMAELDPYGFATRLVAQSVVQQASLADVPPRDSATAQPTP